MKKIKIFDTTLRDGEQAPGNSMHASEKLELSAQLERLGVNIIEAGFAVASQGDFNSVRDIANQRQNCIVASLCRCIKNDIDISYDALKTALVTPRLHLFLATSPIHMEYKLKMTPDQVIAKIAESVKYASNYFSDIQFSCEDAMRSEKSFLLKSIQTAINNGATTINIPDTVGYSYPEEIADTFKYIIDNIDNDKITFAIHCHNDLGLALANTLSAVVAGATQVEGTIGGIGERAGNVAIEEVAMALKTRPEHYKMDTDIVTKQIYPTAKLLHSITGVKIHPTKPLVGKNAFLHESGIHQHGVLANKNTYEIINPESLGIIQNTFVMGKHSGKHAFKDYLKNIGIEVPEDELTVLFNRFKSVADKKKVVTQKDIEYLVSHTNNTKIKKSVTLENYGITTMKGGHAIANITLCTDDGIKAGNGIGDGPIDAAFKAINAILGKEFQLNDWSVNAITEGKDALGAATLRVSFDDEEVTGRGVSTDTVEASLLAYIDGCNKLLDI